MSPYNNALFLWNEATNNLIGILAMRMCMISYSVEMRYFREMGGGIFKKKKKKIQSWNI